MTNRSCASSAVAATVPSSRLLPLVRGLCATTLALATGVALAQAAPNYPITSGQRSTAQHVAEAGVPLGDLAPNAPDRYTIKPGDTLWAISGLYLKQPWRWPELWGMNLGQIRNPHLIYPGQELVLTKVGGRAYLGFAGDEGGIPTVKVSPRVRSESLADSAIPPIPLQAIEPFLNEAQVMDENTLATAPRIVATPETRVLLGSGDRAYARGQYGKAGEAAGSALVMEPGSPKRFRLFRNATPLRDPATREILGYEAHYLGKAQLVRSETVTDAVGADGKAQREIVPATIDIGTTKEEVRIGDRLMPEPVRAVPVFVPRAPSQPVQGQIVSVYGNAVQFAGQNQVVSINRGTRDGIEPGHVLAIQLNNKVVRDRTDSAAPTLHLPGERNGLMVVFRSFDRVSYALILQIVDGVKVGDVFVNP